MLELIKKSTEVTKFKVHEIYFLKVSKYSTRLEGPNKYGVFQCVEVETSWELEILNSEEVQLRHCRSVDWGDEHDQEGPWSVTKALQWLEGRMGY